MKVCLHTNWEINSKYIGGTERFLINLGKELQCFGHEPLIVCSGHDEELYVEGVKVLGRYGASLKKSIGKYQHFSSEFIKKEIIGDAYNEDSLKRLSDYTMSQLDAINADIFHLNSFISASHMPLTKSIVVTNHENNKEYDWYWGGGFFSFFKNLVANKKTSLHQIEHLYTPSQYYANFFSEEFGIPVRSVPLGVPLNFFTYENKENTLKKEYSFDENDIIILLPSRFQPHQKGHDIALEACSILKDIGIPFKIIFTGVKKSSEKYRSAFDDMVSKYDLQHHVKVITFPDINEAYRNTDIVISPERYCSYGLSISESLSLGIPTIMSDIPTYKEIGSNYKHAFFFKSESGQELSRTIINVAKSLERHRETAITFRVNNDLRDCAKQYSSIYQNVFSQNKNYFS